MNDLEIYTIEGISIDDGIAEWAESNSGFNYLPSNEQQLVPDSILNERSVLLAPLDLIPFRHQTEDWILTAVVKRNKIGVDIRSEVWQDGQALWLPKGIEVYCPWTILTTQISALRDDLILTNHADRAKARFIRSFQIDNPSTLKNIHPFELVPPAGFNTLAVVCLKNDLRTRKQVMPLHNEATAICTNVERKLAIQLLNAFEDVGVQCFQDQHGRFQLSVCTSLNSEIRRFKTIQNSWIGLHEAALKFFEISK